MDETYTLVYRCTNCGKVTSKTYPKGTMASNPVECKHCGCHTADKDHQPKPVYPPYIPTPRPRPNPWPNPERDRIPKPWPSPRPYEPSPWKPYPGPYRYPDVIDITPKIWCGRSNPNIIAIL